MCQSRGQSPGDVPQPGLAARAVPRLCAIAGVAGFGPKLSTGEALLIIGTPATGPQPGRIAAPVLAKPAACAGPLPRPTRGIAAPS